MSFRPNHRQPLPQPRAEASVRAWSVDRDPGHGVKAIAVLPLSYAFVLETSAYASDPNGGVVV